MDVNEALSETTSSYGGLRLTNNQSPQKQEENKRKSVVRRLYGPENGQVRKHVRLLEEKSQRSQTGFLGDPNHKVPYQNHPYDPESPTYVGKRRQRNLQNETDDSDYNMDLTSDSNKDLYKPLRIKFHTQALDEKRTEQTAAKIDFIKTEVLPA